MPLPLRTLIAVINLVLYARSAVVRSRAETDVAAAGGGMPRVWVDGC